jgi:hypothetical protein
MPLGNSPELFPVASRHADRGVHQFMAQDRCDLRRHQVFRLAQVRPDKDLKMPVLTALIIPALADMPAAAAARRKSNRNTSIALVEERLIVRTWAPCSGRHSSARPQAFDAVEAP